MARRVHSPEFKREAAKLALQPGKTRGYGFVARDRDDVPNAGGAARRVLGVGRSIAEAKQRERADSIRHRLHSITPSPPA